MMPSPLFCKYLEQFGFELPTAAMSNAVDLGDGAFRTSLVIVDVDYSILSDAIVVRSVPYVP